METTIKGVVSRKVNADGSVEVSYKRYSFFLGILTILSFAIVIPLCFVLVGIVLLPIPILLMIIFYVVQVSDKIVISPGQGVELKKHYIAFKDISQIGTRTNRAIAGVIVNVKGKEVVVASLLRESVAAELISTLESYT